MSGLNKNNMRASELRVGNLLKGEALSIPRMQLYGDGVSVISAYGIFLIDGGNDLQLEPIPLTPQWLERFGFEKFDNDYYQNQNGDFTGELIEGNFQLVWYELASCKYVHQLQNLYFALTGEELIIKNHKKEE